MKGLSVRVRPIPPNFNLTSCLPYKYRMKKLCKYGCGTAATFQLKNGEFCCSSHTSKCPSIKQKNSEGGKASHRNPDRISAKDVYLNLPEEIKTRMVWNKNDFSRVEFELRGHGNHKMALIQERGWQCENCLHSKWNDQPITLELDHVDGNRVNNIRENLKLLCPNCHAQTPTWRGRNINSGKMKVSDDELISALKESKNIRQALERVGLTPKGGNYNRAKKLKATLVER